MNPAERFFMVFGLVVAASFGVIALCWLILQCVPDDSNVIPVDFGGHVKVTNLDDYRGAS